VFFVQLSDWNKRDEKLMLAVEKGQTERVQHLMTRKQTSPFKIDPSRQITAYVNPSVVNQSINQSINQDKQWIDWEHEWMDE